MAMQNLRDKLLKAGLVDKKQKTQADTQDRRDKKQKGAAELAAEEEARQRAFAEKQAAEAEARRQADLERAAERARHEDRGRVRNICEHWALRKPKPGDRRFYFTRRSGRIGHLMLNDELCEQLRIGALAIIERLDDDEQELALGAARGGKPRSLIAQLKRDVAGPPPLTIPSHVLLPPEPTERVLAIDPTAIRFWARSVAPIGVLTELPS
jgi:uncharacterized protein YaiL (DUF2058 family)